MAADIELKILYFGALRDMAGTGEERRVCTAGTTVSELKAVLGEAHPALKTAWPTTRIAVDIHEAADTQQLHDGQEIALLPPSAGGRQTVWTLLTKAPIDPEAARRFVGNPHCGGQTLFVGTVRNHHQGKIVTRLIYEAYAPMARRLLHELSETARTHFDLVHVAVLHRIGEIPIGEPTIAVAASAAHRTETFDAVRWLMHEIKHHVPIFKHETYADGSSAWVRCEHLQH